MLFSVVIRIDQDKDCFEEDYIIKANSLLEAAQEAHEKFEETGESIIWAIRNTGHDNL